ncbi:flagellar hook-length control protein FliK [Halomonas sp. 25-S5]|uniref:flagellar hook-length control protein FliK n=1 Tax=Halomonas sp. 25-S5 TaxID=2994065 RepID=UPI002469A012|nr:flagellar hook-length control protein FliK [Halomonas sp. 25-S5]
MDIQLLVNAPVNAAGNRASPEGDKAPGDAFARHLAGASQARGEGAGTPTPQASSSQAPAAATHGQGDTPAGAAMRDEALKARLAEVSGTTDTRVEHGKTGESAGLTPLLGAEAGRAAWSRLSAEDVESALQSLEQGTPRSAGSDAAGNGVWDALQEHLALIEQAGRPEADDALALLSLAATGFPATGSTDAPNAASVAGPESHMSGQALRTNPLLEAIAADRRAPQPNAAAGSAAAERLAPSLAGAGQASAASDEALRVATAGDALLAQRGEASGGAGALELAGQGAANAINGATGGAMTSAPSMPAQASLPAPVASPAWPQQLGQQLVRLSQQGGEQRVELQLHPAELGPLSVSLKMGDHGAQAQFISAHAQVRQALEQAIPQLRDALAEQGISLGETSVGEQRTGNGDGAPRQPGDMLASAGVEGSDEGSSGAIDAKLTRELNLDGSVDLYA